LLTGCDDESKHHSRRTYHVSVHEAGHALMAVLQNMQCSGIFLIADENQFCTLVTSNNPLTKADYLQSAAGVAAESNFFKTYSWEDTRSDRKIFEEPGAPPWDATVKEAQSILSSQRERIQTLAVIVRETIKLPCDQVTKRDMDNDPRKFYELVNEAKLHQV
jgi:hypothetical protein